MVIKGVFLSDNLVILLEVYVDLTDNYVKFLEFYVDLSDDYVSLLHLNVDLSDIIMTSKWQLVARHEHAVSMIISSQIDIKI